MPRLFPVRILSVAMLLGSVLCLGACETVIIEDGSSLPPITSMPTRQPSAEQQIQLDVASEAMGDGEYEAALAIFQDILAENPTIVTAYLGIGEIHLIQEDYQQAEPAYRRAARLEPQNFDAQYGHGVALQMLGRIGEAIRAFQRALNIRPESFDANLGLATSYLKINQATQALAYAQRAVRANPDSGPARINLGAVYEGVGRHGDAIDEYLVAMELMEPSPALLLNLINALAKEKRYEEVANVAENLIKIEPSANVYERLGWARFKLGQFDESINAYRAATELDPNHWPSQNGVGVNALNRWLLSNKSNNLARTESRDAFRASLRANPDQPKVIGLMLKYNL
jgi:tetratricopeptide (TPR) repeat protein